MVYPTVKISVESDEYPELLKQISDPPATLFCRGNTALLSSNCFSVVGTRMITSYGKEAAEKIVPGLARYFTIVSGLALGIDACAHQTTLDAGGKTIAVLGTPVNDPTPRNNIGLANEILDKGGLLISEYENERDVRKSNWAVRDRIISGLSKGVLIIEAAEKSGSLITATCAAEQNRDVFAVPGNIFSSKSAGPHSLLKKGAKMVTCAQDILEEYSMLSLDTASSVSTSNPTEAAILAILESEGPLNVDEIIRETENDAKNISAALSIMEIKGLIKNAGSGKYRKA